MINQDKPNSSVSNTSKVSQGETWATVTTTWATETRTWNSISKLINNFNKVMIVIWDTWQTIWNNETRTWDDLKSTDSITNISKPI